MDKAFTNYKVDDRSFISYIKREIHMQATATEFTEEQVGKIDIIVSELSSNLIKHAGGGEVLYRITEDLSDTVFEIVCIDRGPGMDTLKMMRDGASTTLTLGHGLGAIERLSSFSQIYSTPGTGTIIYSVVSTKEEKFERKQSPALSVRSLCICKPRETLCGDGYRVRRSENDVRIFFGDGLGHGEHAKTAVDTARNFFFECNESEPVEIIRLMHEKVRRTRGLVASLAIFDKKSAQWKICGVGNIQVRMYTGIEYKNYMSYNGTIGLNIPNSMKESVFPIEKNQHLVMCSDGIKTRWDMNQYPSIFKYDNTIFAAALYRDFSRGNDDASVLIAKVS